jgi:hypothetical protein
MPRLRAVFALVLALIPIGALGASQKISDGELQRFIVNLRFPGTCGAASQSVNAMRSKPTSDPARLHPMIATFVECARGPWTSTNGSLFNMAVFAASSASLLAARYETGTAAFSDAQNAAHGADLIVNYQHGLRPGQSANNVNQYAPSVYLTDAGRIKRDAAALLATLPPSAHHAAAGTGVPAFPATPAPGR